MVNVGRQRQVDTPQIRGNRFARQRVILWRFIGHQWAGKSSGCLSGLACEVIALLLMLTPPVMGQSVVTDLLSSLELSDYPADMWPPPFEGQTLTGEMVSLGDLKGRVVLVNFWASWCVECRPEMPMFEHLHRTFAKHGLTVLGINHRETAARIEGFAKKLGLTFPLLLDPQGEIAASYGVIGLPSTFLVGRDGRPVAIAVGPRDWDGVAAHAIIQALLAETAAKKEK
jgi:peroxiredoxin